MTFFSLALNEKVEKNKWKFYATFDVGSLINSFVELNAVPAIGVLGVKYPDNDESTVVAKVPLACTK